MLALAESTRIALCIREKFQPEHCVRHAVQCSRKHDVAIRKRGRCDHRIILQVIPTAVGVAVIIGRRHGSSAATRSQCNPEAGVVVNGVAENGPGGVIAGKAGDADAVEGVKRDDVALTGARAADCPVARLAAGDTTISVAQRHRSRDVGADLIALDNNPGGITAKTDAIGTRCYHISCNRCAATDGSVD